jgi:hypothetical protein
VRISSSSLQAGINLLGRFRPERLSLVAGSPPGGALDKTEILSFHHGPKKAVLRYDLSIYA